MKAGIGPDQHGLADFSYIPLTLAAPRLMEFDHDYVATTICNASALTVLGYSLMTDARWGLFKVIPYKTHAYIDLGLGLAHVTLAAASVNKPRNVRATFLGLGLLSVVVGILSIIGANERKAA